MSQALINLPASARRGEVIEIRALVAHPMETGLRTASNGGTVPRNIIERFVCRYNGREVFSARYYSAITANPYLSFFVKAQEDGLIECQWIDDRGERFSASARLSIVG